MPTLRDELVAAAQGGTINVVGTELAYYTGLPTPDPRGYNEYIAFVNALNPAPGETHTTNTTEKARYWHAKVILVQSGQDPVVAVIGSSNMTLAASAFGARIWNHESDVIIWSPRHPNVGRLVEALGAPDNDEAITLQANLDGNVVQPGEDEQLLKLRDEILAA